MTISYEIMSRDDTTGEVRVRWTDDTLNATRDEMFNLLHIIPGATAIFAAMGIPYDINAAFDHLHNMLDNLAASGSVIVSLPEQK